MAAQCHRVLKRATGTIGAGSLLRHPGLAQAVKEVINALSALIKAHQEVFHAGEARIVRL